MPARALAQQTPQKLPPVENQKSQAPSNAGRPAPPPARPPVAPLPATDQSVDDADDDADIDAAQERRLREVENRIRELEGAGPAPGTTAAQEDKAKAKLPDKPTALWTAELQADSVLVQQSQANQQVLGNIQDFSDFRRARIGAFGTLFYNTLYRIEFDFALNGRPAFLDVYGQIIELPVIQNVRVGHFFEPFSLARYTSNRYQTFMERPLLDALAPARNLGISNFGVYAEKLGTWQIGFFAADSDNFAEEQPVRGGEALTGRMTNLPYWDEPSDGRYYMHVGGAFSVRSPANRQLRYGTWPGFRPGAFDIIVWPFWVDTGNIAARSATLLDAEWALVLGPVAWQAEYAVSMVDQVNNPNVAFHAWYLEFSWFLTGEHRTYQREFGIFNRVEPFEPFFRAGRGKPTGLGAWQLAFRIDELDLTDQNIQGGRLTDLTFGLNWYLNPYTRIYFNYVHPFLTRGTPGNTQANLVGFRAQFEF